MQLIGSFYKRIGCFIMLAACLIGLFPAQIVCAEETAVEGSFCFYEHIYTREYTYSDDYFLGPSGEYDHDFARLSLGLAMAAFRDKEKPEEQDDCLIEMLENMGFSQIETQTYRTEPTAYSISYGLAVKKIGDTTVLACAICGGGYGMEWASNLTVGDYERSAGFWEASEKVKAGISDYVERNALKEEVKLWITGYSRAGAVANITAADCIKSGMFADVYAYTFATPRTTRDPVAYPNIFNIINKEDIVPKIPLADWEYERYGVDLFMVSSETDSNSGKILEEAKAFYKSVVGSEMVDNFEINYQLRILLDYLLMLMPDSATYTKYLQPLLVDIITENEGMGDALKVLLKALEKYSTDDPAAGEELKALREYLGTLISIYYLQGEVEKRPPDKWEPELGTVNLFYAHLATEYLALMYSSDDPQELFSANTEYIRLIIYGNVDISISDGNAVLKEILADGTELVDGRSDPYSLPDADCYEDKVVITLPADQIYEITVTSESNLPQTISYTGLLFSGNTVRAQADDLYSYIMNKGDTAVIHTSVNGRAIEPSESDHTDISVFTEAIYSPTTAMRLENNKVVHLTISGLVNRLLLLAVILLAQLAASVVLFIRRKKKHLKRNIKVAFVWHLAIAFLFAVLEVAMWYFVPVIPLLKMIPGILVFVVILVYAFKGYRQENRNRKLFLKIVLALAAYMILENLLIGGFTAFKGILLMAVYAAFMTAVFLQLWHKK